MDERDVDILIERALWGLGPDDEAGLPSRLAATTDLFDDAVASAALAMDDEHEALPDPISERLRAMGRGFVAARAHEDETPGALRRGRLPGSAPASEAEPLRAGDNARPSPVAGRIGAFGVIGWIAAAACLVVAVVLARPTPTPMMDTPARLAALEATAPDVLHADWAGLSAIGASDHELDSGVSGEVIWSDAEDEGYMRISGIRANDPGEFQYQLWIFDATRPTGDLPQFRADGLPEILTQRPVDGGVFDVSARGETLVPIDAKLPVGEGVLFAVTRERPGGVVVSDRDIVFLALRG